MFCSTCGRALTDGLRFCDGCGVELDRGATGSSALLADQFKDEVKARSLDAWQAFKLFVKSPVGGLSESFAILEDQRAIQVGIIFAGMYEVALLASALIFKSRVTQLVGGFLPVGDLTVFQLIKVVVLGLVPFASLIAALALVRIIFRGTGGFAGDVYTAGSVLLPFGVLAFAASILGVANFEVILVILLFVLTYSILILYAGCSRLGGISEAGAAPGVPIILLLSGWITKILVTAIW